MSIEYNKTIWQNGDVISVEKLNKIENGIAAVSNTVNSPSIYDTATGFIASFSDGADNLPLKSCVVQIEPIQSGSGDPSPENIRPISGWTGLNVIRCGKNLIDDSKQALNGAYTTLYVGSVNSVDYPYFLLPGVYTFSCKFSNGAHYGALYRRSDETTQTTIWSTAGSSTSASFTVAKSGFYRFWLYRASADGGVSIDDVSDVMLEIGDVAHEYEPYRGSTYSVNWESKAGTVYGGTLDVVNGKLVVDRVMFSMNTSTMNNNENYPGWKNTGVVDVIGANIQTASYPALLNIGKTVAVNTSGSGTGTIYFSMSTYGKNQSEWIAEAIDVQILFDTVNPIEYQLTPQEVRTLLGENNIWSDGGDVEVIYPADTKLYIDRKIAEALS